jgi:hypothetical protein
LLDGLIGLRLLTQELVAGESEYDEVIVRVGLPEGFELLELWSESALGGSIDDEEDFSSIFREGYLFMSIICIFRFLGRVFSIFCIIRYILYLYCIFSCGELQYLP